MRKGKSEIEIENKGETYRRTNIEGEREKKGKKNRQIDRESREGKSNTEAVRYRNIETQT